LFVSRSGFDKDCFCVSDMNKKDGLWESGGETCGSTTMAEGEQKWSPLESPDVDISQPTQEMNISDEESALASLPNSAQGSPTHAVSEPRSQAQSPSVSRPETPLLPHLNLGQSDTPLLSTQLTIPSQLDGCLVSIQDITDMETPFRTVPQLPESPTEPLLPQYPPMIPGIMDYSSDIHSCLSSASCLNSALSTPRCSKKFRSGDSDTGTDLLPVCRICQLPGDKEDFLFSPCRCSGTMMFVHYLCLLVSVF
jgi:hypothetical protein